MVSKKSKLDQNRQSCNTKSHNRILNVIVFGLLLLSSFISSVTENAYGTKYEDLNQKIIQQNQMILQQNQMILQQNQMILQQNQMILQQNQSSQNPNQSNSSLPEDANNTGKTRNDPINETPDFFISSIGVITGSIFLFFNLIVTSMYYTHHVMQRIIIPIGLFLYKYFMEKTDSKFFKEPIN